MKVVKSITGHPSEHSSEINGQYCGRTEWHCEKGSSSLTVICFRPLAFSNRNEDRTRDISDPGSANPARDFRRLS
jgi:hypothetical protein